MSTQHCYSQKTVGVEGPHNHQIVSSLGGSFQGGREHRKEWKHKTPAVVMWERAGVHLPSCSPPANSYLLRISSTAIHLGASCLSQILKIGEVSFVCVRPRVLQVQIFDEPISQKIKVIDNLILSLHPTHPPLSGRIIVSTTTTPHNAAHTQQVVTCQLADSFDWVLGYSWRTQSILMILSLCDACMFTIYSAVVSLT